MLVEIGPLLRQLSDRMTAQLIGFVKTMTRFVVVKVKVSTRVINSTVTKLTTKNMWWLKYSNRQQPN